MKSLLTGWRAPQTDSLKTKALADVGRVVFIQKRGSLSFVDGNV